MAEPGIEEKLADPDRQYRLLRQMMAGRDWFNFILVVYQGDLSRDRLLARLTADLDGLGVDHLILDLRQYPDNVVLITAARELLEAHPAAEGRHRALSVIGLERHLDYGSGGTRDKATGLLPDANLHRDLFPEKVPVPMALWGTSLAQPAIAHRAPDLWHWRVGSADLVGDAADLPRAALLEAEIPRPEQSWQRQDKETARKREALLRELLAEDDTPVDATGPAARRRAGLTRELGQLLFRLGEVAEAEGLLRDALARYQHQGMEREQAYIQGDIADILLQRGDLDTALRIRREEELPVYGRLGDVRSATMVRGQIADILFRRGDLDAALRIWQDEVLPVYVRLGDVREAAVTRGKIADILFEFGDYDAVLRIRREEELPVYELLGDIRETAVTNGKIADSLYQLGELDAALHIYQYEELPIHKRLGDIKAIAMTMGNIANILFQRGDLDAALSIRRGEVLPIFERLGAVFETALTRWWIARILLRQDAQAKRGETIALMTQAKNEYASIGAPEADLVANELALIQSTPESPTP